MFYYGASQAVTSRTKDKYYAHHDDKKPFNACFVQIKPFAISMR